MSIPKTARQRRMWILPAPHGGLDKTDRYAIGIFYALAFITEAITFPLRAIFTSKFQRSMFISLWERNVFVSKRKQGKNN